MTIEQLREKCPCPVILHWEQNHFVVLYDVHRSKLTGRWKYSVVMVAISIIGKKRKKKLLKGG